MNALLIPRFASAGAAIGTLAAEAAVLIVQYVALKNEVREALFVFSHGNAVLWTALLTAFADVSKKFFLES